MKKFKSRRARLMVDHSMPRDFADPEMRKVQAYVVDGLFAMYRLNTQPNVYFFATGDGDNWWRISNGLHFDWLEGVLSVIKEVIEDR